MASAYERAVGGTVAQRVAADVKATIQSVEDHKIDGTCRCNAVTEEQVRKLLQKPVIPNSGTPPKTQQ